MIKYKYFVSYSHTRGFGNAEVLLKNKILNIRDLIRIADMIGKEETKDVVILNFILLE